MENYYGTTSSAAVKDTIYRVFAWMSGALAITGLTAYYIAATPAIMHSLISSPGIFIGIFLAQLAVVMVLSMMIMRLSFVAAFGLFIAYAILTGVTLSTIFLVYTSSSIVVTFMVAAGMFASMAVYGAVTKSDLTSLGSLMGMMLWGLILALVGNLFIKSSVLDLVTAFFGVIIFAGLTAYDMQRIKGIVSYGYSQGADKIALIAALQLYLDFINLFLSLLRIMGNKKQD
ncbi:MAG: Bax inhibitor-1/YccA family protein [Candidatus Babeliaceae bacterium]|jgi:hypothetical protein